MEFFSFDVKGKSGYQNSKYAIALELTKYPETVWRKKNIEDATHKVAKRIAAFIFGK